MVKLRKSIFGGIFMISLMGFGSLLTVVGVPVAAIFILIWIYQIKRNSDILVEQNRRIINLLENGKTE
jgi:hypothetical protein